MGSRGPPKTPLNLLKRRGSPRAKSREKSTHPGTGRMPSCPRFVPPSSRKYWRRLIPLLREACLFDALDADAIGMYATTLGWWVEAKATMKREGHTFVNKHGAPCSHPAVAQALAFDKALRAFQDRFGLSPSARSTLLKGKTEPQKEHSSKEQLLRKGG